MVVAGSVLACNKGIASYLTQMMSGKGAAIPIHSCRQVLSSWLQTWYQPCARNL
jgi:hypothetical protein